MYKAFLAFQSDQETGAQNLGWATCGAIRHFENTECFRVNAERRKFSKKLNIKHLDYDKNEIRRTKRNDFTYFIGKNVN